MGRKRTISDEELLETARVAFVELGIGAPAKEIARRAGVSEGVLFQRFTTKEDLFFAAMIPPAGTDLSALLANPDLGGKELIRRVTLQLTAYFRLLLPSFIPLISHPAFRFEEFAHRHPQSPLFRLRFQLVELALRERQAGRLGDAPAPSVAALIWSTAFTIAFFEQIGAHGGRIDDGIVTGAIEALWTGLAPRNG
jgi:AcrR family transcriptional regulator